MWDLNTIQRINDQAVQNAQEGKPIRAALFQATSSNQEPVVRQEVQDAAQALVKLSELAVTD